MHKTQILQPHQLKHEGEARLQQMPTAATRRERNFLAKCADNVLPCNNVNRWEAVRALLAVAK